MVEKSRRDVLKISSTGITAGLAGCSSVQDSEPQSNNTSSTSDDIDQDLRARIEELEATVEAKNERIEELEATVEAENERIEELKATVKAKNERIEELEEAESTTTSTQEFPPDVLEQAKSMARDARNSIVTIHGEDGSGGTGWVLNSDRGHIVTNSHVVRDDQSFSIRTFDEETGSATRVGYYEDMIPDIALLQTNLDGLPEFSIGDESNLTNGDPLLTIGHPGSVGDWIMSIGRHESYEQTINWLLSTVPTSQGNSGGPLLTLDGDVVGVVSGTTTQNRDRDDFSKSDELYTELPSSEELTTSIPAETLVESIDDWT